jgi:hypothetical protein
MAELKGKLVTRKISEIKTDFFVRMTSNQERVKSFAAKYQADGPQALKPLAITWNNRLVDGRHRKLAAQTIDENMVLPCIVIDSESNPLSDSELLMRATEANMVGQPLPMTDKELDNVCQDLYAAGEDEKTIIAFLKNIGLDSKSAKTRSEYSIAHLREKRANLAITDIGKGMTIQKAAKKHKIDVKRVQETLLAITGKKPKNKMDSYTTSATQTITGFNKKIAGRNAVVAAEFKKGAVTKQQVINYLKAVDNKWNDAVNVRDDWFQRLSSLAE